MSDDPRVDTDGREAVTEAEVAEEEAQRDDAGRGEAAAHSGWGTQLRMFGGIGAFMALIGVVYWFMSYEWVGTVLLALTSGMALLTGAYVGWPRPGDGGDPDGGQQAEPGHDPRDGVWFPEASVWPFAIGAGMVLVANGLLLGRWLLIPSAVFLVWALAGMVLQGRRRV